MNKEEFISKIKDMKANVPNDYFFIEYNKCVCDILDEKDKLQQELSKYKNMVDELEKWLEDEITNYQHEIRVISAHGDYDLNEEIRNAYQKMLNKVRGNNNND